MHISQDNKKLKLEVSSGKYPNQKLFESLWSECNFKNLRNIFESMLKQNMKKDRNFVCMMLLVSFKTIKGETKLNLNLGFKISCQIRFQKNE